MAEFGDLDTRELEIEDRRLFERGDDEMEAFVDYRLEEIWAASNTKVYQIAPEHFNGGTEVRQVDSDWWLARDGKVYWALDCEYIGRVSLVDKEASDDNKAIWHSLDTEVFAVVRDIRGLREAPDPELVRRVDRGQWLSLWRGVYEMSPTARIDDLELVPAAEWERSRSSEVRHTQVQQRIAARLRERGLEPVIPDIAQVDGGTGSRAESEPMGNIWDSLRSAVYVWVRSCQIDDADRHVRHWQGDRWVMRTARGGWCGTIDSGQLRDWGCLVDIGDWEGARRAKLAERRLSWREAGF